jgi:hypothetical protein
MDIWADDPTRQATELRLNPVTNPNKSVENNPLPVTREAGKTRAQAGRVDLLRRRKTIQTPIRKDQ